MRIYLAILLLLFGTSLTSAQITRINLSNIEIVDTGYFKIMNPLGVVINDTTEALIVECDDSTIFLYNVNNGRLVGVQKFDIKNKAFDSLIISSYNIRYDRISVKNFYNVTYIAITDVNSDLFYIKYIDNYSKKEKIIFKATVNQISFNNKEYFIEKKAINYLKQMN